VIKTFTGEKTLTLHSQYHSPFSYKNAGEKRIVLPTAHFEKDQTFTGSGAPGDVIQKMR